MTLRGAGGKPAQRGRHPLARLDAGLMAVERLVAQLAGAGILLLMLAGCVEVLSRKLFGRPIPGVVDVIEASMVGVALLGMAYCQAQAGNVRMTLIVSALRGRLAHLADLLGYLVGAVFIAAVLMGARVYMMNYFTLGGASPQLGLPLWMVAALVPVSLVLLLARLLLQVVAAARLVIWPGAEPQGLPAGGAKHEFETEAV